MTWGRYLADPESHLNFMLLVQRSVGNKGGGWHEPRCRETRFSKQPTLMPTTHTHAHSNATVKPVRTPNTESLRRATPDAAIDDALVRRFADGDEAAFVEIMDRYRGKIFTVTLGLLRNHADAEEITQDTFIRA